MIFLSGCAKLSHLQQLLTLKAYSQDKDRQAAYIEAQDQRFEELLKVVKTDALNQYPDQESFLENFGDPVFVKDVVREGRSYRLWLYRYAKRFFDSDKVYLYFDKNEKLHHWKHEPARNREG